MKFNRSRQASFLHLLRNAILLGSAVGILGNLLAFTPWGWLAEESIGLSGLFKWRGAAVAPSEVILIAINRETSRALDLPEELSRWPRSVHAELIDRLVHAGAAAIVFDIYFEASKKDDEELAQAISDADRVILFKRLGRVRTATTDIITLHAPVPAFVAAARATAPFPLPKVPVSVSRFWSFYNEIASLPVAVLQYLALSTPEHAAALRLAQLDINLPIVTEEAFGRLMSAWRAYLRDRPQQAERLLLALAQSGQSHPLVQTLLRTYAGPSFHYLNFYGPPATIETIPYQSIIKSTDRPDIHGKIAFVGSMDPLHPEQEDNFYTVFSTADGVDLNGVEILATAFANLLTEKTLYPPEAVVHILLLLLLGCVLGGVMYGVQSAMLSSAIVVGISFMYLIVAYSLFAMYQVWLPIFVPLLIQLPAVLLAGLIWKFYNYRKALRQFVPTLIADRYPIGLSPDMPESSFGVCLSSDVTGYTTLSEQLPPSELVRLSNAYFATLNRCVQKHHGQMLEIAGDGATFVWLSTRANIERATRLNACLSALDILAAVERFNAQHPQYPFHTRLGLHAGALAVGHMGGDGHFIYGVAGDTPNTAARIENLNKHLATSLLAEQRVVQDLEELQLRRVGQFRLKGKREALTVFQIIGLKHALNLPERAFYRRFEDILAFYDARFWQQALAGFLALLREQPADGPSRFYLARCQAYLNSPPGDEHPVIPITEKI